jgi:hypothetical protein
MAAAAAAAALVLLRAVWAVELVEAVASELALDSEHPSGAARSSLPP